MQALTVFMSLHSYPPAQAGNPAVIRSDSYCSIRVLGGHRAQT